MDKDKQPDIKPASRFKLVWILSALVVLALVVASFLVQRGDYDKSVPKVTRLLTPFASPTESMVKKPTLRPAPTEPNIIYNPPKQMMVGVTVPVEVRITNKAFSEGFSKEDFEAVLEGMAAVRRDSIITGEFMSVELCCGEPTGIFDITPLSDREQLVGLTDFTHWGFEVTPKQGGTHKLRLKVSVNFIDGNGKERNSSISVKAEDIEVAVNLEAQYKEIFEDNWQWLGLLLLIPILVVYVTRAFKGKKKSISGNESVFLSYRRSDSSGYTLAVYQKLKEVLGDDKVFMDMNDIPHGVDFSEHLDKVLGSASTVLVMIGDSWLDASNEFGRRLDNPGDFVRIEIATALERDVRVIPVLLNNAEMPSKQSLPEALQDLSKRNAILIHNDQFDASIERLVESIG